MKKTFIFIISLICFIFGYTTKISATDYSGALGYSYSDSSTTFWFLDDGSVENIQITLNIEGLSPVNLTKYEKGMYFYTYGSNLRGKEYYYTVCKNSECVDTIDPLAKGINIAGDRNVILSAEDYQVEGWNEVGNISTGIYDKSIYAIEAEQFSEQLTLKQNEEAPVVDSIFARLSKPTTYGNTTTSVGYEYLEKSGMKYIEIGDLYDSNNYYYPNHSFSSKGSNVGAISELKNLIIDYKNIQMNVIARVNFLNPSDNMKTALSDLSSNYIENGKINLNNPIMQKYIKDVYMHWVKEYKIGGFYILDAQLYGQEYLNSLIDDLLEENPNLLIYTDSKGLTSYYTSNDIQDALIGSLFSDDSDGILSENFSEDNFNKLINGMFGGYYQELSKYKSAANVINNIGSLDGLDIYSKIRLNLGLAYEDAVIKDKIRLAFLTTYLSVGIPRVVAGNEFFNTNMVPNEESNSTLENAVCKGETSWCYFISDKKSLNWEYLINKESDLNKFMTYRHNYVYQYPSVYAMEHNDGISYDKELAKSGIVYLTINYKANKTDDIERSIMLVNYSTKDIEVNSISEKEYTKHGAILGRVGKKEDKTNIQGLTFFTFTEVKENDTPNWVYIVLMVVLLVIIFGVRALCIRLLKTKKGIDYQAYTKEQRQKNKKGNKKNRVKEPSVFETYLKEDPIFKRKKKKEKVIEEKMSEQEPVENSKDNSEELESEDKQKEESN